MRRLLPLAAIETLVWLALLSSTLLISKVVFLINFGTSSTTQRIATETTRVLIAGMIILIWLLVWKKLTDFYFWRTIERRRTTA